MITIQVIRKLYVLKIIQKIQELNGIEKLLVATELWNEIDALDSPEEHWDLMLEFLPDCFYDNSANSIKFTY